TGSDVLSLNQPIIGTATTTTPQTSVSGYIQGSVNIVSPSSFQVDGEIFYPLYIIGDVTGTNLITFGTEKATAFAPFPANSVLDIQGTATPGLAITSANNHTFTGGTAGSFTVTATGVPTPTLSEIGTLP